MARRPQQARSKALVQSILQAGFIALGRHGPEHTTTRHIADIAGIGVGSLYEYFENKEAVYAAMLQQTVDEIVAMLEPLTPELVRMDVRSVVSEVLYCFKGLLEKDDSRYLKCAPYVVQFARTETLEPIQKTLMDLVMQYVMHHPELMRLNRLPTMSYIIVNGGIFTTIRHLSDPNPSIGFDQLTQGLGDMLASYVEMELGRH